MVISLNPEPSKAEFDDLLNLTISKLNRLAEENPKKIGGLTGSKLEPYVKELMSELAKGTPFENSIELIGGQKFPDIVARKLYGIEIKTTTKNHWKTTGNSIMESTRVEGVERIYMLFGKLGAPIEFKCRPYEECLSEVVVTHSPRYLIDMNLELGKTIFDKIDLPYNSLRQKDNPVKPIINYYKRQLKPGQDLWWIDNETEHSSSLVIDIWGNLRVEERSRYKNKAMVYFPEIFSNQGNKFGRLALWLVTREAIVCPNIRDIFTAGGKQDCLIRDRVYKDVPRIFVKLFDDLEWVLEELINTSAIDLSELWKEDVTEENKIEKWIKLIGLNSKTLASVKHLNIEAILRKLIIN